MRLRDLERQALSPTFWPSSEKVRFSPEADILRRRPQQRIRFSQAHTFRPLRLLRFAVEIVVS
jgi:hypothetical protein